MQYKKSEIEHESKPSNGDIAFKILFTTMVFAILVTYFTK